MKKITSLLVMLSFCIGYANESKSDSSNPLAPVTYEAEKGRRYKGANEQDCATCSELKQVGDIGGPSVDSGYLVATVNVAVAGTYKLNLSYSSGDPRTVFIGANGMPSQEVANLNSGAWTTVGTKEIQIMLNAGTNGIKFYNHTGYAPNIDKFTLDLFEAAAACVDCIGPFEAEAAVFTGEAKAKNCDTCSGGQYASDMGYDNRYFTQTVTTPKSGIYKLYLSYSSGSERSISITPNGNDAKTVTALVNSIDWDVIFIKSFDIELMAGSNTLKFHNTISNWAPDIDKFSLVFSSALSLKENEINSFSAYPNPTSGSWKISNNKDAIQSVSVFDVTGKQVLNVTTPSNEAIIDASNFKSGVYISKIKTNNGVQNLKLVKK